MLSQEKTIVGKDQLRKRPITEKTNSGKDQPRKRAKQEKQSLMKTISGNDNFPRND